MIYYLINTVFSLLALIEIFNTHLNRLKKPLFFLCIFFLALFAGTRLVGFDINEYQNIFTYSTAGSFWSTGIEPGFSFLNSLFAKTGFNSFLLFVAIVVTICYSFFINKYSPFFFLSLLLYFSSFFIVKEMGQMRQGLAMGIVLIACSAAFERNLKRFLFFSVIAITIHYSAIVVLPVYYICTRTISTMKLIMIVAVSFVFLVIPLFSIVTTVLRFIPIAAVQSKVSGLLLSDLFVQKIGLSSSLILRFIIVALLLIFRKSLKANFAYSEEVLMLYIYGFVLFMVFNSMSEVANRTSIYFRVLEILIIPNLICLIKRRSIRTVVLAVFILNSFISINRLFSDNDGYKEYNPYKSFLFE